MAVSAVVHGGLGVPLCDGWSWMSRELVGPVVTHPADGTRCDLCEVGMSGVELSGGGRVGTVAARWTVSRADGCAGGLSVVGTKELLLVAMIMAEEMGGSVFGSMNLELLIQEVRSAHVVEPVGCRVGTVAGRWTVSRADGRAGGMSVVSTLCVGSGKVSAAGAMGVGVPGSVLAHGVSYRVVSSAHVGGVGWVVSGGAGGVGGVSFIQIEPAPGVEVHVADVACAPRVFDVTVVSRRRQPLELELVVSNESESDGPPKVWRGLAHGSRVQVGPVGFGRRVRVSVREGGVVSRAVVVQVMTLGGKLVDFETWTRQKLTSCCECTEVVNQKQFLLLWS